MSLVAPADVRTTVDLALRGKRRDVGGIVFGLGLLGTLLLAPAAASDAESDTSYTVQLLALVAQTTAVVLLMQRSAAAAEGLSML